MTFLSLENVSHAYFSPTNYMKAIEDITLEINEGEFISIIGPSGCGKSTILSLMAKLIQPTDGVIKVSGTSLQESAITVGYMLQQDYLFPWKSIIDNVLLGPKINNIITNDTLKKADQLLKDVNLKHTKELFPNELSGGMRQRIALVRTLLLDPQILLFDEPFSALDYVTKLKLENLVVELMNAYQKTAILVTHDLAEAISMSDRVVLMDASPGRIRKIFTIPDELRKTTPFYTRRHPLYQPLFDEIWQHLDNENLIREE